MSIGFAHDYAKARILVTSRIVGYHGTPFRHAEFSEYTLQDLDTTQIQTFAQGWFKLVFLNQPQEVASRLERIQQALDHSPAIAQLAGNPLLLTIIAIIAKHQELPRERVVLYEHAVKVLCHHWDVTGHKIADTPADFMRENDKLELLRRIAARMQQGTSGLSGNAILAGDLQHEIEAYLSQRWQQSPAEAARIGHAMIEQLRARNFILCFYGVSLFGFVHRTFLEYFCASEIKQRFDKRGSAGGVSEADLKALFLAHHQDDTWHEILRLICGMVSPPFAGQLIDAILPDRKAAFKHSKSLTLAIQCLAETPDLNQIPDVSKRVLNVLCGWFEDNLYTFRSDFIMRRSHILAEELFEKNALPAVERIGKNWVGREAGVNWLKSTDKVTASFQGSYCFGRMVAALWSDHIEIERDLISLSQEHHISRQRMAFDALARCFKESTKILLKEQLMLVENETYIWTLTNHYLDLPETYELLIQCLQHEQSEMRRVAVKAVAGHYHSREATYGRLIQCLEDRDGDVRQAVVEALAGHYYDSEETYTLLTNCLKDEDGGVRKAAVQALAEHYNDREETYKLLSQCLQDMDGDFRQAVIEALAEYYFDREETYALLTQCLQDWDDDVRESTVGALAELKYGYGNKMILLSFELDGIFPWLDTLESITQDRVKAAAKKLALSHEQIRQYYEEITVDIPLILEWRL